MSCSHAAPHQFVTNQARSVQFLRVTAGGLHVSPPVAEGGRFT